MTVTVDLPKPELEKLQRIRDQLVKDAGTDGKAILDFLVLAYQLGHKAGEGAPAGPDPTSPEALPTEFERRLDLLTERVNELSENYGMLSI